MTARAGRVLITGGAGSVGRGLARTLALAGRRVRILDLPLCDFSAVEAIDGVEIVRGSITDQATLTGAVVGVDAAVHLAALLPPTSERDRDLTMAVNVAGTSRLVSALAAANPAARVVLSSSVCVYGDTSDASLGAASPDRPPITTERPTAPVDLYGESKVAAEEAVRAGPLPYAILRISGILTPEVLAFPAEWPFTEEQRIEFICRDDVVAALAAAVESDAAVGRALNVAGGASWRMRGGEYVAHLSEMFGVPPDLTPYRERPGTFDWYDTDASQAALGYQRTTFGATLEAIERAIAEAFGV